MRGGIFRIDFLAKIEGKRIYSIKINTYFLSLKKEYYLIIIMDDKSDLLYARLPHNNFHEGLYNGKEEWQR